jgi:hypothetical protein
LPCPYRASRSIRVDLPLPFALPLFHACIQAAIAEDVLALFAIYGGKKRTFQSNCRPFTIQQQD